MMSITCLRAPRRPVRWDMPDNVMSTPTLMNDTFTHTQYRLHAHLDILKKQFSRPTAAGGGGSPARTTDGYSAILAISTGRQGVASLHTVFALRPWHDFFQLAAQVLWGLVNLLYAPTDDVTLDLKLHATGTDVPEFVWPRRKRRGEFHQKGAVGRLESTLAFFSYTTTDGAGVYLRRTS